MSELNLDQLREKVLTPISSSLMPDSMQQLAVHLAKNVENKLTQFDKQGKTIEVLNPEWARENSELAGRMHANIILETYGSTYALPNKDPVANQEAIESGDLDVYLMKVDGELTGTTCLVNTHDGRAELGRSAALGNSGASVILDYRILDWLTDDESAAKYHTLFATLRSAPNRDVDGFDMRGGQAVTSHWKNFPGLEVNGFGPLYLKHGSLEQFSCASLTRALKIEIPGLFVEDEASKTLVNYWHDNYSISRPTFSVDGNFDQTPLAFEPHYPPLGSGITEFVHSDIVQVKEGKTIRESIDESEAVGSPFVQVIVPIDADTRELQKELRSGGYQIFSYQPATTESRPALVYGRVTPGVSVVETFWQKADTYNPFWRNKALANYALRVASQW